MNAIPIEYPTDLHDYSLLDSGGGEKLETIGGYTMVRPDPRALWEKTQLQEVWNKAHALYKRTGTDSGSWNIRSTPSTPWKFHYKDCTFLLRPTDFKHVGIFPEQAVNWDWMTGVIGKRNPTILNLFAYTGGATVIAAKQGGLVTHVDSVKSTISWANDNYKQNDVDPTHVRWIEDDAYKFVLREGKRGKTYDGIIMDPPRFGRGAHGEVWKLEQDLPRLLTACKTILSPHPLFVLINAYTADISSLVLHNMMQDFTRDIKGTRTFGELATKESQSDRLLPQGIFTRWQSL